MQYKRKNVKRLLASVLIATMLTGILPVAGVMAAETVKEGTADVSFGGNKAYDVTAQVTVDGDKITNVTLDHNTKVSSHADSAPYADKAKAMAENFIGVSATDADAIAVVDGVSGATVTSDAYRNAVYDALGLQASEQPASYVFGSAQTPLAPGTYKVPISLKKVSANKPYKDASAASAAFPATATLTVAKDGKATITSSFQPVTIGPIEDMAYDVKVYQEDGCQTGTSQEAVEVLESTEKPASMPGAGKTVPTKIAFQVPDNSWDGVYLSFKVDAMGSPDNPGTPDAWLQIDYTKAAVPGSSEVLHGSAKVNQFGKYTIYTDVTVTDGVITNVAIEGRDFISPTHQATNQMKIDQVTGALQHNWDGMAPTPENAEKIFKKIMKEEAPDEVIDGVSGATYSAKAVRDAVMKACELQYQDEIINVPESVAPGIYEVDVEYASDVVWHSLLENQRAKATLTVNKDKTMTLDMDLKSGTDKEPLYILGFNGVYPNNDREANCSMKGCKIEKGLSSNDYEDENFAKGTQVVTHVSFPLLGGLQKNYNTNAYLYVPAMKRLNGDLSGVHFVNGKFNVDVFAKIYWNSLEKVEDLPDMDVGDPLALQDGNYFISGEMVKIDKKEHSMANNAIDHAIKLTVKDGVYTLTVDFDGMMIGEQLGYLGTLKYFADDYTVDKYGRPDGKLLDATIDSYQLDEKGNRLKDNFGTNYPDLVSFPMIPRALEDGYVPLQVFVPIMEAISEGNGTQEAFLKLDWESLKKASEDSEAKPEKPVIPDVDYKDIVDNAWYQEAVNYVVAKGIMTGTSEEFFSPEMATTRGMIVTMLYRLENKPNVVASNMFSDVPRNEWYSKAITWASKNNIVSGYGDGRFGPNDAITREEMATILYRYADYKNCDLNVVGNLAQYGDKGKIHDWASDAMNWANGQQLINGMGDGTIAPQGNALRMQVASVMMRFCENVVE